MAAQFFTSTCLLAGADPRLAQAIERAQEAQATATITAWIIAIVIWLAWAAAAWSIGSKAGRGGEGLAMGLLFGPLGVPIAYLSVSEWRLEQIQLHLADRQVTPPQQVPHGPLLEPWLEPPASAPADGRSTQLAIDPLEVIGPPPAREAPRPKPEKLARITCGACGLEAVLPAGDLKGYHCRGCRAGLKVVGGKPVGFTVTAVTGPGSR